MMPRRAAGGVRGATHFVQKTTAAVVLVRRRVAAHNGRVLFVRPDDLLAGFYAGDPDPLVPELRHCGEFWAPATHWVGPHRHAVWELFLQLDGVSSWSAKSSGKRAVRVGPGGLFAAAPGVCHTMAERPGRAQHYLFAAVDVAAVLARRPAWADAWDGAGPIVCASDAHALLPPFRALVREVGGGLADGSDGLRLAVDALVLEATRLLRRNVASSRRPPRLATHPAVARAVELMQGHPGRRWRVAELARLAGVSPSHLRERFRRELGAPPHRHLLRLRLDRARELLADGDVPVTRVALELGFASSQHLAGAYKRAFGTTPRQARKV